jgi:serine/threonine-protein kinase CHEK1
MFFCMFLERDNQAGKLICTWKILVLIGIRVQLAINRNTQVRVAIKIQTKWQVPESVAQKEVLLHKQITKACSKVNTASSHIRLIKLLDFFQDQDHFYSVLEWAGGGELFDLIEPDLGLEEDLCHFYFCQLIYSVKFLHENGIAHRDLKPENLLLDEKGNLYISDFGLSTIFQYNGVSRMLTTACGSPVYVAPEVLTGQYHGPAADIWSCGIILFTMLVGSNLCYFI